MVAATLAVTLIVACGSTTPRAATTSTTQSPPQKSPSKLPAQVTRTVEQLKAGETPGDDGTFTGAGVPVRDGKLQLELNASGPVTDAQKADLNALGADIVAAGTEVGLVDVWVPYARVDDVARLSWVLAVTVPSPTRRP